jgi:glycosyltransferase involved in cell wall biosynthesis
MIPTYNQAAFIGDALEGAIAQDYENLEIVISNDCSTDNTELVVSKYFDDPRINYHKNEINLGRVRNYRHTLENYATGDWVVNCDGDDYYTDKHFISEMIGLILQSDNVVIAMGGRLNWIQDVDEYQNYVPPINKKNFIMDGKSFLMNYYKFNYMSHLTTIYNRKKALEIGFYKEEIISTDLESILRLCLHGNVLLTTGVYGVWRNHGDNTCIKSNFDECVDNFDRTYKPYRYAVEKGVNEKEAFKSMKYLLKNNLNDLVYSVFVSESKIFDKNNKLKLLKYLFKERISYVFSVDACKTFCLYVLKKLKIKKP